MSLKSYLPEKKNIALFNNVYLGGKYKYILENIGENFFSEHSTTWGKR